MLSSLLNNGVLIKFISLVINEFGDIIYCVGDIEIDHNTFDRNLLEGIDQKTIEAWANQQMQKKYGETLIRCKMQSIMLVEIDTQYYLAISTICETEESSEVETMCYNIS